MAAASAAPALVILTGAGISAESGLGTFRSSDGLWAIFAPVRSFLQYLLANRHEAQALLQFQRRTDDAVARGRIDARASMIARRVAGHPTLIVSEEPVRSFNTGPNQVVAWVVHAAAVHAERLFSMQPKTSAYSGLIEAAMAEISAVKRLDALREPLKNVASGRRPGPNSLRDAARSRRQIYRQAISGVYVETDY